MRKLRQVVLLFAWLAGSCLAATLPPRTSNVYREMETDTPVGITNRSAWREAIGIRFLSVKDYGADPTGTTNSLPAFTSAIAAVSNLVASGATPLPIYVPSGTYRIDAPIRILSPKLTLYGDGYDSRIVLSTATNAIEIGDGVTDVDTVTLRALRIGTSVTNSLRGIYSRGHIDSQIHGVLIDGAVSTGRRGFEFAGLDMRLCWGNNLADLYTINCAKDGIYLNGVNSTVFTSPHIISCWGSGLRATNWTYGVSLFGPQVGYCDEYALLFHGSRAVTIHGGYTEFCGAKGGLRAHLGFGNCSGISVVGTHIDLGTWTNVYAVSTLNVSGLTLRGLNIDNPGPGCDALLPEAPTTYTSESVIYDGGPKTRTVAMPTLVMSDTRFLANLYGSNVLIGPYAEEWAPLSVSFTNADHDSLLRYYNGSLYLIQNRTNTTLDEWPAVQWYSGTNRGAYFGGGSISGRYIDIGYGAIDRVRFLGDVLMAGDARVVSNLYAGKLLVGTTPATWATASVDAGTAAYNWANHAYQLNGAAGSAAYPRVEWLVNGYRGAYLGDGSVSERRLVFGYDGITNLVFEGRVTANGTIYQDGAYAVLDIRFAAGTNATNWAAGNHSHTGYLTNEVDPVFAASVASGISAGETNFWAGDTTATGNTLVKRSADGDVWWHLGYGTYINATAAVFDNAQITGSGAAVGKFWGATDTNGNGNWLKIKFSDFASGTAGRVAYWDTSTNIASSDIRVSGSSLGIGTNAADGITFANSATAPTDRIILQRYEAGTYGYAGLGNSGKTLNYQVPEGGQHWFYTGSNNVVVIIDHGALHADTSLESPIVRVNGGAAPKLDTTGVDFGTVTAVTNATFTGLCIPVRANGTNYYLPLYQTP